MNAFRLVSKILFLSVILSSFSCSSTNQSVENQNLQATKVEPLAPITAVIQESDLPTNIIPNPTSNIEIGREITDEEIFQGRDISQYNKADTSKSGSYKSTQKKMRNFIWKQWQNKKRGYIENRLAGIDAGQTDHIFIEPDEEGKWKVVWKIVRWQSPGGEDITDLAGINTVEQVEAKSNKSGWKLIFKDKTGEVVTTL